MTPGAPGAIGEARNVKHRTGAFNRGLGSWAPWKPAPDETAKHEARDEAGALASYRLAGEVEVLRARALLYEPVP